MKINSSFWTSAESAVLLNPRLPTLVQQRLHQEVEKKNFSSTLWLQSSGTESSFVGTKLVTIDKSAFLAAVQGCVDFYQLSKTDIWLNSLPLFHVGGLAIEARCFLSGAKSEIYRGAWSAHDFQKQLQQSQANWASLVPTQVYDLVQASIPPPPSLRAILVGGGSLSMNLWLQAYKLGWPLLPSYGMTETSALLAGSSLETLQREPSPSGMDILPHIKLRQIQKDKYAIRSRSLFSGYLLFEENQGATWKPRSDPFILDDRLRVEKNKLYVLGRESQLVKILGETVNLQELTDRLESVIGAPFAVVAAPEDRKGYDLHLFVQSINAVLPPLDEINKGLLPFQRISEVHILNALPRTELGKIKTAALLRLLKDQAAEASQEN